MIELKKRENSEEFVSGQAMIERSTLVSEPNLYELGLQTQTEKDKDQLTYTYMTGDQGEPPPEWVATRDKNVFNCLKQHFNNNIAEGNLNRLYYDRQKIRETGGDSADIDKKIMFGEKNLAVAQTRAEQMSSLTGGILNTLSDAMVGMGRRAGTTIEWGQDKDYTRFAAGAELRAHPDYTMVESLIHGAIEKGGEDALWLMPTSTLGKIGKLIETRPLVGRIARGLVEGLKWETVLAGPEILHKAIDEALEADENYYDGSPLELDAAVRRDTYLGILKDKLMFALIGGGLGMFGATKFSEGKLKPTKEQVTLIKKINKATPDEVAIELTKDLRARESIDDITKGIIAELKKPELLTVLEKPGKIKQAWHTAKAWGPTYSAYIEKRFGTEGVLNLYTKVHRATKIAENLTAKQTTNVFKGIKPLWFSEKVMFRVGRQTLKMTRGQKLDIVMQKTLNAGSSFVYEGQRIPLAELPFSMTLPGKVLNKEEVAFIDKVMKMFLKQGHKLNLIRTVRDKPFKRVAEYYPAPRYGHKGIEPIIKTKKGWSFEGFMEPKTGSDLPLVINSIDDVVKGSIRRANNYMYLKEPTARALKIVDKIPQLNKAERAMMIDQLKYNFGARPLETAIEKGMRTIIRNLTVGILGVNPFVAAKQLCSGPLALVYVKPTYWFQGWFDYWSRRKEVTKFFTKHSFWTSKRLTSGMNKEMQDLAAQHGKTKAGILFNKARDMTMWPIKKMDEITVIPIMNGAYRQAYDEIVAGHLSPEVRKVLGKIVTDRNVRSQAITYAEAVVAKTQPMFDTLNRSRLANSGVAGRSFTMFASATNQLFSLLWRTSGKQQGLAAAGICLNIMGVMSVDYLRDIAYLREHPPTWESVGGVVGEVVLSAANLVYFARDIASWIKYHRYGRTIDNPLIGWGDNMLGSIYNLIESLWSDKKMTDWQIKQLFIALAHSMGVPTLAVEVGFEATGAETRLNKPAGWIAGKTLPRDIPYTSWKKK